jgi:Lipocalin-like domain
MESLVVVLVVAVAAARGAFSQTPTPEASHIREALVGSWVLVSRRDITHDGKAQIEPSLGETPRGLLFYGADGHMAVQLMRLNPPRSSTSLPTSPVHPKNNTDTSSGYDAYFGTYTVDPVAQTVTHHVEGALSPGDVGKSLTRRFRLQGAELTLSFDTSASDGTPVTRTVVWRRTQ